MALNFLVSMGKIIIGLATGVLAITADGFHSLIDGLANIAGLVAIRVADKPADANHPYGHRRYETLAALLIGALLLLTAWEIVREAVSRLFAPETTNITPVVIVVLLATLVVNLFLSRYELREGKRLRSEVLLADSANTSADVVVTISVIISTLIVALFGWSWVDPLAAIVIVIIIVRAAWGVLRQTSNVLVDTAPYAPDQLMALAADVPAVQRVVRARSRGPADAAYVAIDVQIAPETTADRSEAIAEAIRENVFSHLEGVAEVEVHFVPEHEGVPDYALTARARADALGLSTHEVRVSAGPNGRMIDLHVEVPPGQTLAAAHDQVTKLEQNIRASLPDVADVVTHIEPAFLETPEARPLNDADAIAKRAETLLRLHYPQSRWHHLRVTAQDDGYALALHVAMPPNVTVEAAHEFTESAEIMLRSELPELARVTIHAEPETNSAS
jgi:cation diffusion facilitator family transporter